MSKPNTLDQRRALYQAAVVAQDAAQVAALLKQGGSPDDTFRGRTIFDHACRVPTTPDVLALLLGHRNREVRITWLWDVLADDQFTAGHVAAVFDLVCWMDDDFHQRNVSRALEASLSNRQDKRLAEKIRFMCSKGWKPAKAWFDGKLPFHDYLDANLVEAARACVENGTDPHEPMRSDGLESPEKLLGWSEFEARLIARQREEQGASVVLPMTRQRVRA